MNEVVEHVPAREVVIRELNSMRGRLCTVIESAGLPHKQERALVQLIKNLSFQNQHAIERVVTKLDTENTLFTVINNRLKIEE